MDSAAHPMPEGLQKRSSSAAGGHDERYVKMAGFEHGPNVGLIRILPWITLDVSLESPNHCKIMHNTKATNYEQVGHSQQKSGLKLGCHHPLHIPASW